MMLVVLRPTIVGFLPTPSTRRATPAASGCGIDTMRYFYPRPPRGGRLRTELEDQIRETISTHALHEEGDSHDPCRRLCRKHFYPRPPRGGRLILAYWQAAEAKISTHALHEEGDGNTKQRQPSAPKNFYPRPPRGGRRPLSNRVLPQSIFLPTPSTRRATHAVQLAAQPAQFLPTPSTRRATGRDVVQRGDKIFLPTPSTRRATLTVPRLSTSPQFLPTPSTRRATCGAVLLL